MAEPKWQEGEPCNLEAAATDSLEFLLMMETIVRLRHEDRQRLKRTIGALKRNLALSRFAELPSHPKYDALINAARRKR